MLSPICLATPEEVASIAATSDLGPNTRVLAMATDKGPSHLAVIRDAVELDPCHFSPDTSTAQRAAFIWGIENILRAQGVRAYYFNTTPSDTKWSDIVQHWGATPIFTTPQQRYKRTL